MNKFFKKLKVCFNCTYEELATHLKTSRQYMYQLLKNDSPTHKAAAAFVLNKYIDKKIKDLQKDIELLEQFKDEINNEFAKGLVEEEGA